MTLRSEDPKKDKEDKKEDAPKLGIESRLFDSRQIVISGEINQKLAQSVTERLLALATVSDEPITVFINSQGGHVEAGDTIHDMLNFVKPKVNIVGTGWVASAGALIYLAVPLSQRFSLPNTRFMLHQPSGGVGGQATDIAIEAQEILKMMNRINLIISRQTGQPLEKVESDTDRNFWMSAEEAKAYGIVGEIVTSSSDLKK
jgi:ATP-dependent Clp protease protease subunit